MFEQVYIPAITSAFVSYNYSKQTIESHFGKKKVTPNTHTVVQGRGGGGGRVDGTPHLGFCSVTVFQKDFVFWLDSLYCAPQDEVCIMGCGAAMAASRQARWWPSVAILDNTQNENEQKAEIENF